MNLVDRKTFILLSNVDTSAIATYIKRGKIIIENNMFDLDNQTNINTINKIKLRKNKALIPFCKKECKCCGEVKNKKEFFIIDNKRGKRLSILCTICLDAKIIKQKEISSIKIKLSAKKSYIKRKSEISKKASIKSKENRKIKNDIILNTKYYKCESCLVEKERVFFYKSNPLRINKKCNSCKEKELIAKNKNRHKKRREIIKKNPELLKKEYSSNKRWRSLNKNKINNYIKTRKETDELFYLSIRTRGLINGSFKRKNSIKSKKTTEILGCSISYFKTFIESKFKDGMSWDNRSEWHIDHKKPLATAKTVSEIIKLNHYTNLQPLWAIDNLKKGAKYANS